MSTCDRPFTHAPHTFVDGSDNDRQCDGQGSSQSLAQLLAAKPTVAGIGVATIRLELEVMCA